MSLYDKGKSAVRQIDRSLDNADLNMAIAAMELIEKGVLSVEGAKGILVAIRDYRETPYR